MNSVGKKGEKVVATWLVEQGYNIIEQNWRVRTGEIDIIALDKDVLVFVEVKTLPNTTLESLTMLVGYNKQIKIAQTAKYFLQNNRQYHKLRMRFDVIVLKSNPFMSAKHRILHIKDAFGDCNG